jgi:acetoacetyl-CoA synthetase
MAEAYVHEMRSLQPHGPYALAGHSLGGLVAFEMACRLRALGETVEWLGLIDSDLHHRYLTPISRLRRLRRTSRETLRAVRADPRARIALYARKVLLRVARRPPVDAPVRESTLPPLVRRLENAGWAAFRAYRPAPYAGAATFFQVEVRRADMGDPLPRWRRLVQGGLTVEYVPGGHADVVAEPNVRVLAERVSAHLDSPA